MENVWRCRVSDVEGTITFFTDLGLTVVGRDKNTMTEHRPTQLRLPVPNGASALAHRRPSGAAHANYRGQIPGCAEGIRHLAVGLARRSLDRRCRRLGRRNRGARRLARSQGRELACDRALRANCWREPGRLEQPWSTIFSSYNVRVEGDVVAELRLADGQGASVIWGVLRLSDLIPFQERLSTKPQPLTRTVGQRWSPEKAFGLASGAHRGDFAELSAEALATSKAPPASPALIHRVEIKPDVAAAPETAAA